MNIPQSIRTAGSALKQYFTDPASLKQIGKAIGTEAALGAAAQQIVPRMVGQRPAQSIPQSLIHAGVHSAVNVPVSGALQSIGTPAFAAATTGGILGSAAAAQFANQIEPEITQENHADFHQLYAMQQMHAAEEQQRVNNQIQLAYARNYSPPTFMYHHSSRDTSTTANEMVRNILR
jgi:hypothetical protein